LNKSYFYKVTAGAKGSTLEQLLKGMEFPELGQMKSGYSAILPTLHSDGNITLETANSAFLQVCTSTAG
jgi:serine protease inhibitor